MVFQIVKLNLVHEGHRNKNTNQPLIHNVKVTPVNSWISFMTITLHNWSQILDNFVAYISPLILMENINNIFLYY